MKVIGLAGGIASGKSEVARQLQRLGGHWLNADQLGHAVLAETDVMARLRQRWGDRVADRDGRPNREAIAEIVFDPGQGERELRFLEEVLHPRIRQLVVEQIAQLRSQPSPPAAVVLDAPLLFEAGWQADCDLVLFVDAPRAARLQRVRQERGWTDEQLGQREARQWSPAEKRRHADVVIDNSSDLAFLREQIQNFWKEHIEAEPIANHAHAEGNTRR